MNLLLFAKAKVIRIFFNMMQRVLLGLLLLCTIDVFSQYIKGKVVDEFDQPLASATVYYEGTTYVTLTDEEGKFNLVYDAKINRPLVVSYLGYNTAYVATYTTDVMLKIIMEQATNSLKEVVIKKDRFSRKEKLAIFRERFLGITRFGLKTVIENEDDIAFEYDEEKRMLKAYSDKPLQIFNRSLGYKINYELVDFEIRFSKVSLHPHTVTHSFYSGYTRFEEITTTASIIRNREAAYQGSPMHFFRCLKDGSWGKDSFQLFEKGLLTSPEDHFKVSKEDESYKVSIKKQNFVDLKDFKFTAVFGLLFDGGDQSTVYFYSDVIYIDDFGNLLSTRDVAFSGAIQSKRVGDTLPINYGL